MCKEKNIEIEKENICKRCKTPLSDNDIKEGYLYCYICSLNINIEHRHHMEKFNTFDI